MKVVLEPNTVSDCIKAFLVDPQWPEYIKDSSIEANQEANLFDFDRERVI